jgi:hypothetical protein
MTFLPPPRPGPRSQNHPGGYVPQLPIAPIRQTSAPTLGQFWRSDTRIVPGRKPAKWAGRTAFWLGLLALGLFIWDVAILGTLGLFAAIASPLGVVAFLFALIAIIAGVGRGLGIFGLIFAVASSTIFWSWAERTFG